MQIRLTPAVKYLLIGCIGAFLIQQTADQFFGAGLQAWFALTPSAFALQQHFWQIVTYAFLHADVMHLVLNMMMLAFVGGELEALWGTPRFLRYYFFCCVAAGFFYLLLVFAWKGAGIHVPMVGASGGIYGLLVAYGILFGERTLLFMMVFPMKAKHFVMVLGGIEMMSTLFSGRGGGLASAAHLGGMLSGFAYLWINARMKQAKRGGPKGPKGPKGGAKLKSKKKHLKLIIDNEREVGQVADDDRDPNRGPRTWH